MLKDKSKKVLLISPNFLPEPTGIGKVNGEMMLWLSEHGFECSVITTYPYYPYWKVDDSYKKRSFTKEIINAGEQSVPITVYRCPSYVPQKPTGKKRVIQDASFWGAMMWKVFQLAVSKKKFDLIITVAPPFHLAYLGLLFRKLSGGKLLYHIQDLQIEAAQDLKMISSSNLFKQFFRIEKNILNKADYVSSISTGMIGAIKEKVNRDVLFFPNWVETSCFYPINDRVSLKAQWGYKSDDIVFLYSGAVGEKQGLEDIIQAAQKLQYNGRIKFIICGTGPYTEKLIQQAASLNLSNLSFLPMQEKEKFNEFLNMADYHLILQKSAIGNHVMPSKLATILAIGGVSVVTAMPETSLHDVVKDFDIGYIIDSGNFEPFLEVVKNVDPDDTDYRQKSENARNYATKYLDIDNVMADFVKNVFPE